MMMHYFHLHDADDVLRDDSGRDIAGDAAIRAAALIEARALICAGVMTGRIDLAPHIDVENAAGRLVHQLFFSDAVSITD